MASSATTGALMQAVSGLHLDLKPLSRTTEAGGGSRKYRYVQLHQVVEYVTPLLMRHGLVVQESSVAVPDGSGVTVSAVLHHLKSGEWLDASLHMPVAKRGDAQAAGSALTYARRYLLGVLLHLTFEDEDDDGEAAKGSAGHGQSRQPARQHEKPAQQADGGGGVTVEKRKMETRSGKEVTLEVATSYDPDTHVGAGMLCRMVFGTDDHAKEYGLGHTEAKRALLEAARAKGYPHWSLIPWRKQKGEDVPAAVLEDAKARLELMAERQQDDGDRPPIDGDDM